MHTTKDYSKSPAKAFDAVQDVKDWFGERWDTVSPMMAAVLDPQEFSVMADFGGIQGYPVEAWYELYHGGGSWAKAWDAHEAQKAGA